MLLTKIVLPFINAARKTETKDTNEVENGDEPNEEKDTPPQHEEEEADPTQNQEEEPNQQQQQQQQQQPEGAT